MNTAAKTATIVVALAMIACATVTVIPWESSGDVEMETPTSADLSSFLTGLGNTTSQREIQINLNDAVEYYLDRDTTKKDTSSSTSEITGFYGKTLIIDGDPDNDGINAKVTIRGNQEINNDGNQSRTIVLRNIDFVAEKEEGDRSVLGLYHYKNLTMENCTSDGTTFMFCSESIAGSTLTVTDCDFTVTDPAKSTEGFYALTLKGTTLVADDVTVSGYTRGINLEMGKQEGFTASATATGCKISGTAEGKKALQFSIGSEGCTAAAKGCEFRDCDIAISLNEELAADIVISAGNTFESCNTDFLYSATSTAMSDAKIVSANDAFDGEPSISAESGNEVPENGFITADWYDPASSDLVISNEDELEQLAILVNSGIDDFSGKTVNLVANRTYDISHPDGSDWTPIGTTGENADGTLTDHPFKGTFEGNNAVISGLKLTGEDVASYRGMDSGDYFAYGFFGGVVDGTVRNLTFVNFEVNTPGTADVAASGPNQNSTTAVAVGALLFSGEISGITIGKGTVTGNVRTAGVVGYIGGAKNGDEGPAQYDGARMGTIVVKDNVNNADIVSAWTLTSHGTAAGIISTTNIKHMSGGVYEISGNINNGTVKGFYAAGILASDFSPTTEIKITGNKNTGDIECSVEAAGTLAVGISNANGNSNNDCRITVSGNVNSGNVTSSSGTASGIMGSVYDSTTISNNSNSGNVAGNTYAAGIASILFGGNVSGNTNSGNIALTATSWEPTKYPSAGGIVAVNNDGTIEGDNIGTGDVSGEGYSTGNVLGILLNGEVSNLNDRDIGAVRVSLRTVDGSTTNGEASLLDSNLAELTLILTHTQSSEFILNLEGTTIGSIEAVSPGGTHTGTFMRIRGGTVSDAQFTFDQNTKPDSMVYFNLSLEDGVQFGNIDVDFQDGDVGAFIATDADSGVESIHSERGLTIGTQHGDVNEGHIGVAMSDMSVTSQSDSNTALPDHCVYTGTDQIVLDSFRNGGTQKGLMNEVLVTSLYPDGDIDTAPVLRDDAAMFVPAGITVTISAPVPEGSITGFDETSRLEIAEGGSYGDIDSGSLAFTEGGEGSWSTPDKVSIGDTGYATLQGAISAADNGDVIVLEQDITESVIIPSGKDITIDLNGHTLKNAEFAQNNGSTLGNHTITVEKGATLTVRDSSTEGTGTVDCLTHARAAVYNLGTFTLESGTLTRSAEASKSPTDNGGNSWYAVFNGGDMTFDGGYVHQNGFLSSLVINRSVDGSEATMTINGGKFEQPNFIVIKNEVSMTITDGEFIGTNEQSVQNWGDAKIDGGDFYGNLTSITMGNGDGATESAMDITGGDIVGDVIAWNYHTTDTSADNSPKITIGGDTSVEGSLRVWSGTFNQETESDDAVIEVSGGRFSQEVDDRFLAPGFAPVKDEDGNYVVGSVTPEITLDTTIIIGFIGGTESYIDIAAECNVSGNVTWESTDASVVTVSDGRITFVGPGWAYVHAWLTAESGKTDMATVEVAVTDVSDLEGLTFSAVTDDTLYRIMDDWYDAIESLEGWNNQLNFVDVESESDTFTIPYDVFEPLGWAVTSDNHDDYDFLAIHFPDAGGYEILDVTDTDEGLTVTTTSGYSPFLFLYRETTGDSSDDSELPPFIPFPPEQGGDPVEVYPSGDNGSSSDNGDGTLKVVAVAAAAVIAAILAIVLASTYRKD